MESTLDEEEGEEFEINLIVTLLRINKIHGNKIVNNHSSTTLQK